MNSAMHISRARVIMDSGQPFSLTYVKKNGAVFSSNDVVSLRYDFYTGLRTVKFLKSGEKRTIHDVCIIAIDNFEVFL